MLRVSPSELAKFQRCRRQWALTYFFRWAVDSTRSSPVGAALLGTRIHAAMEAHYGYDIDPLQALAVVYDNARESRPEYAAELTAEQGYATIMVDGYQHWAAENGLDEEHEVVSTEQELETAVLLTSGEMAIVTGKLDQIVRRRLDGALLLRDWKTVGTLGKADLIVLDPQMRIYSALLAVSSGDLRTDGALYTMMLRSKHTARAKGPFYEQIHINYNDDEQRNMMTRVTGVLDDMDRVTRQLKAGVDHRLVAYPNPIPDRCAWDCPFVQVCPLYDDGSRVDAAMEDNYLKDADPYAYRKLDLLGQIKAELGVDQGADTQ
jgi:RecB family exonuclease